MVHQVFIGVLAPEHVHHGGGVLAAVHCLLDRLAPLFLLVVHLPGELCGELHDHITVLHVVRDDALTIDLGGGHDLDVRMQPTAVTAAQIEVVLVRRIPGLLARQVDVKVLIFVLVRRSAVLLPADDNLKAAMLALCGQRLGSVFHAQLAGEQTGVGQVHALPTDPPASRSVGRR